MLRLSQVMPSHLRGVGTFLTKYSPGYVLTAYCLKRATDFRSVSRSCGFGLVNIGLRHYAVPSSLIIKPLNHIHKLFCPRFGKRERMGQGGIYFWKVKATLFSNLDALKMKEFLSFYNDIIYYLQEIKTSKKVLENKAKTLSNTTVRFTAKTLLSVLQNIFLDPVLCEYECAINGILLYSALHSAFDTQNMLWRLFHIKEKIYLIVARIQLTRFITVNGN